MSDITEQGTFKGDIGGGKYEFFFSPERPNEVHIAGDLYAYGDEDVSVTVPLAELESFLAKVREEKERNPSQEATE